MKENSKIIAINRKAFHDYEIIQKYEAGLELHGSEVKSIREGKINLKDSYAILKKNQIFIIGMHIGQYSHTGFLGHDPYRNRKLLLHKKEILKIFKNALGQEITTNIVFSCGSGVTASVLALAYSLINNKYMPTIYDGSWAEYGKK